MKKLKELKAILTSIYCINKITNKDKEIANLIDYAFEKIFKSNTRYWNYIFSGQTREQVLIILDDYLEDETTYKRRNYNG